MRIARKTSVALLLSVLILPTGALAPAHALTPTTMTAFSMTPAVSSPTGLGTTTVTVSTHLIDPDGIAPVPAFDDDVVVGLCPCVVVERTPLGPAVPQPGLYIVPLTLTGGTATDGTWTGRFVLGSGQTGHWGTRILAGDLGLSVVPNQVFDTSSFAALPSPFTAVGVDIRGTNRPVIGLLSVIRQANGRFLVKGTAYRATTRVPIRNTRFEVTGWCQELNLVHAIIGVRTNSVGVYAVSLTRAQLGGAGGQICVAQVAYPGQWRLTESVTRPVP